MNAGLNQDGDSEGKVLDSSTHLIIEDQTHYTEEQECNEQIVIYADNTINADNSTPQPINIGS